MTEDQRRNVGVVGGVDDDGDPVAVVEDGDGSGVGVHGDFDRGHGRTSLFVVDCVDEDLVEDFEESGVLERTSFRHCVQRSPPCRPSLGRCRRRSTWAASSC